MDAFYCLSVSGDARVICHHRGSWAGSSRDRRPRRSNGEHLQMLVIVKGAARGVTGGMEFARGCRWAAGGSASFTEYMNSYTHIKLPQLFRKTSRLFSKTISRLQGEPEDINHVQ